jgi:antitoxin ParD1/3/4
LSNGSISVREGGYASASDYLRDLVSRDRAESIPELSLEDLREMISQSRQSGPSLTSFDNIISAGIRIARSSGILRD